MGSSLSGIGPARDIEVAPGDAGLLCSLQSVLLMLTFAQENRYAQHTCHVPALGQAVF